MNYLDDIAARIKKRVPEDVLPSEDTTELFRTYAVLALALGSRVRLSDVHNAWVAWMLVQHPDHRALKPFNDLAPDVQRLDMPFVEAIRSVADELGIDRLIARPTRD